MHTTINLEFGTGPMSRREPHCTRQEARKLLEGLRSAYQSLLPTERIVIRDIVAQSARTQFAQEMNVSTRRPQGRVLKAGDIQWIGVEQLRKHQ